jgi:phage shock protein A
MGMIDVLRRRWRYFTAKTESRWEANADPKVQLEQAIADAQEQHRRLVEQAANVVANQKQHELQLNRAMEELEKVNASTRQALVMAQQANAAGDPEKSRAYNQGAEALANRLIATEEQVEQLKTLSLQSAQAADQARAAVQQNSLALQQKLAERQRLLSQLDQAKMQEQLNAAIGSLNRAQGTEAPTLDQVRQKIEAQYAKAIGVQSVTGQSDEAIILEVQQAAMGSEARNRLESMREELGLPSASTAAIGAGTTAAVTSGAVTSGAGTSGSGAPEPGSVTEAAPGSAEPDHP